MPLVINIQEQLRNIAVPVLCVAALIYFGYHVVQGERGLLSWVELTNQINASKIELAVLDEERRGLEHQAKLLRLEGLDPDLLEERARMILGVAHPDELIILYDRIGSN